MYDGIDLSVDVPDVVVHAVTANVDIHGSLVWNATTNTMSFVKTGGVLAPDAYQVTLRSGATGFHDADGHLLDGNDDLIEGDNYTNSFTVTGAGARVLGVRILPAGRGNKSTIHQPYQVRSWR